MMLKVRGNGIDVTNTAFQQALDQLVTPNWNLFGQDTVILQVELLRIDTALVSCLCVAEVIPFGRFEAEATAEDELEALACAADQLMLTLASLFNSTHSSQSSLRQRFHSDSIRQTLLSCTPSNYAMEA